jgi:pimeloyl-ACP methyl ester carboxylesterase
VVLPDVGHCPHDEAPDLVNPILRRWILGSAP